MYHHHIAKAAALTLCVVFAALRHNVYGVVGSAIYGVSLIALYTAVVCAGVYRTLKARMTV